ncbi:MAG: hypothetical protein J5644_00435 [Bacteroidales bacterium]|nr:hypothetical protein [Bacteroidales bacterium]
MNVSQREFEYMKEHITKCLIAMLMEREGVSIREAFDIVYNSVTFAKLSDPETGLFFQSPGYVYSYLESEIPKPQATSVIM